jgi:hypothetical protein
MNAKQVARMDFMKMTQHVYVVHVTILVKHVMDLVTETVYHAQDPSS